LTAKNLGKTILSVSHGEKIMKIAVITDDFKTVSAHFGRAQHYEVFTVDDGKIIARESRSKASHTQFVEQGLHVQQPDESHGSDPASQHRHGTMMDSISDCQVLLARGMGMGAYEALNSRGIHPIITDIPEIQTAIDTYLAGGMVDHPERLH
jgi:predicted Fe-Mo cluster-binding NifX family protein